MNKLKDLAAPVAVIAIAACASFAITQALNGSTKTVTHTTTITQHVTPLSACPATNAYLGCGSADQTFAPHAAFTPAGPKFADVSDWNPSVNWAAVKHAGMIGVVIKAGEGLNADPTFTSHLNGARAAGLKVAAYWFERPIGCTAQATAINRVVPHGLRVIFDEEVPGLQGYAVCERAAVQSHTGYQPGTYTAPGTLSDRSTLPLWEATYGPTLNVLWRPLIGWQYTSTAFVPGIGVSDESVNYGLFPTVTASQLATWTRALAASKRALAAADHTLAINRCVRPYRRGVCIHQGRNASVLSQRVRYFTARIKTAA